MSKKHFIELADMIAAHNKYCADKFTDEQSNALASFCKEQNSAFMRDRGIAGSPISRANAARMAER